MKSLIVILLMCPLMAYAGWWSFNADEWEGFVYPNKNNLTEHINIGVFKSLESCRAAALKKLSQVSSIEEGDYECGLNCGFRDGMGDLRVCKKTER
jgi:hypothetical protein